MAEQTTLEERFGKCPYATAQSLISGKWAVLILFYLEEGPLRFNELLRKMPKMTHATLSVQLKTLEENGLVKRVQYEAIPPHVEYSLTEIGHPSNIVPMQAKLPDHKQERIEAVMKHVNNFAGIWMNILFAAERAR